jgi:hypothetical protein
VCAQVENFNNGNWYNIAGGCNTQQSDIGNIAYLGATKVNAGTKGHVYRTWDFGYVEFPGQSAASKTYNSSPWTF